MKWGRFQKDIANATHITLVGPLYNKRHHPSTPTIYVDGGANFRDLGRNNHFATICIGDGDSCDPALLDHLLPMTKDYSDLAFAMKHLPASIQHVDLLGFLGGRKDHELMNLGTVHHYLFPKSTFTSVRFDDLVVAFCGGLLSLEIKTEFSILVFEPSFLTISGACAYTHNTGIQIPAISSLGLSNKGFGQVLIDSLKPCFIFLN